MLVYALICEAHSDDDRLLGVYSSVDAARAAYDSWPARGLYPFIRIEQRDLDAPASERPSIATVYETGTGDD
jgi:hypothetical protein